MSLWIGDFKERPIVTYRRPTNLKNEWVRSELKKEEHYNKGVRKFGNVWCHFCQFVDNGGIFVSKNQVWYICFAIHPSLTARSTVWGPMARAGEGTNIDVCGVHLHAWWLVKNSVAGISVSLFLYIYIDRYISKDFGSLKYAVCKLGDWYVVDQTLGPVEGNRFGLFRFFFLFYESLRCCLHHLNIEGSKWFKTGKQIGVLGACGWFRFWGPS